MSDEVYALTQEGKLTAFGVVSSLCHGYDLEQAAVLNGLDGPDSVKIVLWMLLAEARIVEPPPAYE